MVKVLLQMHEYSSSWQIAFCFNSLSIGVPNEKVAGHGMMSIGGASSSASEENSVYRIPD